MSWNPEIYNQFKEERYAPFYDLQLLIKVKPALKVIDLGCGTGELTGKLSKHLPGSLIVGIDSSPAMLKAAGEYQNPGIHFQQISIEEKIKESDKYDLVFSNAALQWVENHRQLFATLSSLLNPGGQLAIQVPANHNYFTHKTLRDLASTDPYKTTLNGFLRKPEVLEIETYSQIFFDCGCKEMVIYEKVYPHVLKDAMTIYDWVSGTAILPYLERLTGKLKEDFIKDYKIKLREKFLGSPVFYPFKRIIMWGIF